MLTNRKFELIYTHWYFRKNDTFKLGSSLVEKRVCSELNSSTVHWYVTIDPLEQPRKRKSLNWGHTAKRLVSPAQPGLAQPCPALPRPSPVPLSSGLPKNLPFYDFILMAILEKDLWQQIISQSLLANFMVCSLTIAFNDQEHSADSAPQKHPSFRTRPQSKYPVLHWETL